MPKPSCVEELTTLLRDRGLPWWAQRVDRRHGGYLLDPQEKQLATQSRMIWTHSHAHRHGLGDYLRAAEQGVEFLLERFADRAHGGFVWKTDRAGRPLDERKYLYGNVFAVLSLVEYGRAVGSQGPIDQAMALFRTLLARAHDDVFGGWLEDFEPDWRPITEPGDGGQVEVPGLKSANAHLHTLEALAELHEATGDVDVARALAETVEVCTTQFFPADPGAACPHRSPDWQPAGSAGVSIGHNVEFAWLLTRAERALGREPTWQRLDRYLEQALVERADACIWWETAETLAALATAISHRPDPGHLNALERLLRFALAHQIDPADGVWIRAVAHDGSVVDSAKVGTWKDAYHEVRATILLDEAFAGVG